jgi:hypothetical protein
MTTDNCSLHHTRPICLARPSHWEIVAAPLWRPCRRGAVPTIASQKHGVVTIFGVGEDRTDQAQPSIPLPYATAAHSIPIAPAPCGRLSPIRF